MERLIGKLLQDFEKGKMTRRQLIQSLSLAATAASAMSAAPASPADTKVAKATYLNHVSYQVSDYAKTRDFYVDLFGMTVQKDDPVRKQCRLLTSTGESFIVARTKDPHPFVDHICFTLANWDQDKSVRGQVQAELKRRGLAIREVERSLFIKDPDGIEIQMGGKDQ